MIVADFDFELPEGLIAQAPAHRRDGSRLLVVDRSRDTLHHTHFDGLGEWLDGNDLVVVNDSRVLPARLSGNFEDTGGRLEALLLRPVSDGTWRALVRPAKRCRPGRRIRFPEERTAQVAEDPAGGATRLLTFEGGSDFFDWLERVGAVPLPPYIGRPPVAADRDRYQTLYARKRGSVAAPTAGLHFTDEILQALDVCPITLHVGYGTFKPITASRVEEHQMEEEPYSICDCSASRIQQQLAAGRRVVAVGTTTTRALEHAALRTGAVQAGCSAADLFIVPGFRFQVVGALLTNFHLPRSTLLMLVSAFAGRELIRRAYREAIRRRYRFYSYGDAMLIL